MFAILFSLALAQTPDAPSLIEEAVSLRRDGNLPAAIALLDELEPMVPPEELGHFRYERGLCAQLAHEPLQAEQWYRSSLQAPLPEGDVPGWALDVHLRLAMVLEDLGRYEESLEQIQLLAALNGWSEDDQLTIALQQGISEVNLGQEKKGRHRLEDALDTLDGQPTHIWLQAKARYTLAKMLYAQAMDLHLSGPQRQAARNYRKRSELMKQAEAEILALIKLNEVEWILASLIQLGDAWRDQAAELRSSRPPPHSTEAEIASYHEQLEGYAQTAERRAWNAYDQGITLAARLQFESPRVDDLKARREELSR